MRFPINLMAQIARKTLWLTRRRRSIFSNTNGKEYDLLPFHLE